jgi:hypothetical protein
MVIPTTNATTDCAVDDRYASPVGNVFAVAEPLAVPTVVVGELRGDIVLTPVTVAPPSEGVLASDAVLVSGADVSPTAVVDDPSTAIELDTGTSTELDTGTSIELDTGTDVDTDGGSDDSVVHAGPGVPTPSG